MRVAGPFGCRCQTIPPCSVSTSRSSNRVPRKPSNAGGGKGPDFGSGLEVGRIGRVTMLSITSNQRFGPAEGSRDGGEGTVSCRFVGRLANPVGEPDAGNPPVRFDEREVETEQGGIVGHRQPKGPPTRMAHLTRRATSRLSLIVACQKLASEGNFLRSSFKKPRKNALLPRERLRFVFK